MTDREIISVSSASPDDSDGDFEVASTSDSEEASVACLLVKTSRS